VLKLSPAPILIGERQYALFARSVITDGLAVPQASSWTVAATAFAEVTITVMCTTSM
jgi:hypothetical protein